MTVFGGLGTQTTTQLLLSYFSFLGELRVTNLYNMLPVRTTGQLEVLLLVIQYSHQAKLVTMLSSFFAGVDEWMKVC